MIDRPAETRAERAHRLIAAVLAAGILAGGPYATLHPELAVQQALRLLRAVEHAMDEARRD